MSSADDPGETDAPTAEWRVLREPDAKVPPWEGFLDVDGDDEATVADLPGFRERATRWFVAAFAEEREVGTPFLLAPLAFGAGSVVYFMAPREPTLLATLATVLTVAVGLLWIGWRGKPVLVALALVAFGFACGKVRTEIVDTTVVSRPVVGSLSGSVVWTERRANGSVRYTIDVASFDRDYAGVPERVRIVDRKPERVLAPGRGFRSRVRLMPPSGPVVPGGYDFGFHGWFAGRGAIGSVLGAMSDDGPPTSGLQAMVGAWRFAIGERITEGMDRSVAPLARALVIGDRSGITEEVAESLRVSGLAHILAISGLHMMLVTGLVFVSLRKICAFASVDSLRFPVKKAAAVGALLFAVVYLFLSGMNVSTQRAFVMVCIMLGAVLLDRRAAVLRNVAIAAFVVLAWQPEAVFSPGFQMSFAAAAALVSAYGALLRRREAQEKDRPSDGWFRSSVVWIGGLSFTSLVAGFATAPFAAYHFHRVAALSLVANLLAMPVVTFLVMPLAVLSVIAMPLGLDALVLPALGWSLHAVAWIAGKVASWEWIVRTGIVSPVAFLVAAMGFSLLVLLRTHLRLAGVPLLILASLVPSGAERAVAVVNEDGRNVAVIEADRLVFSAGKPTSFANSLVAESFPKKGDAGRFRCDRIGCVHAANGAIVAMSKDERSLLDDCERAAIIVSRRRAECPATNDPLVLDRRTLAERGSTIVLREADGSFALHHAYGVYPRPWTRHRFVR